MVGIAIGCVGTGKNRRRDEKGEDAVASDQRVIDIRYCKPKRIPQLIWRECIKKLWEVDPHTCPKCTTVMKFISFFYKRTVIKKILTHLGMYQEKKISERHQQQPRAIPSQSRLSPTMMAGLDMMSRVVNFKKAKLIERTDERG